MNKIKSYKDFLNENEKEKKIIVVESKEQLKEIIKKSRTDADLNHLDEKSKQEIIADIESDFEAAYEGIKNLPWEAKFGVYTAYRYYKKLLKKLQKTPSLEIKNTRIRVSDYQKVELLARCYVKYRLNITRWV